MKGKRESTGFNVDFTENALKNISEITLPNYLELQLIKNLIIWYS